MIFRDKLIYFTSTAILILMLFSFSACVSVSQKPADTGTSGKGGVAEPVYYGEGGGENSIDAIQTAKKAAVRLAAEDLLGRASVRNQKEELSVFFDSINDIEPYVVDGSMNIIDSINSDGFYTYLSVSVNLDYLAVKMSASGITGGQVSGAEGEEYSLPNQKAPRHSDVQQADAAKPVKSAADMGDGGKEEPSAGPAGNKPGAAADLSAEELGIIRDYIDSLTYMVYFNDTAETDSPLMKTAVLSANRFLEEKGAEHVDLPQIERIKDEQQLMYEEETGKSVGIMQWIAHKLNADIYIEILPTAESGTENDQYYSNASVTVNAFNALTAESLVSAASKSLPTAFSRVSETDAINNAVSSAVNNGMQIILEKAENETARAASYGFRFKLVLMNTSDSGLISDFEKALSKRVRSLEKTASSAEESSYDVYLIGDVAELEEIIYDTAGSVPGFNGILLVMQRGNSIIFDTGL